MACSSQHRESRYAARQMKSECSSRRCRVTASTTLSLSARKRMTMALSIVWYGSQRTYGVVHRVVWSLLNPHDPRECAAGSCAAVANDAGGVCGMETKPKAYGLMHMQSQQGSGLERMQSRCSTESHQSPCIRHDHEALDAVERTQGMMMHHHDAPHVIMCRSPLQQRRCYLSCCGWL